MSWEEVLAEAHVELLIALERFSPTDRTPVLLRVHALVNNVVTARHRRRITERKHIRFASIVPGSNRFPSSAEFSEDEIIEPTPREASHVDREFRLRELRHILRYNTAGLTAREFQFIRTWAAAEPSSHGLPGVLPVAQSLGVPKSTAQAWFARAIGKIRKALDRILRADLIAQRRGGCFGVDTTMAQEPSDPTRPCTARNHWSYHDPS